MTEIEKRALEFLSSPRSCTEVGEHLWADAGRKNSPRQSWARPAGALLARLRRKGLVRKCWQGSGRSLRLVWERDDDGGANDE